MLVLFETATGYALFRVLDEGKLAHPENLHKYFESAQSAQQLVTLTNFLKFDSITDAMAAATALVDSSLSKQLKEFLQTSIVDKKLKEKLAVADAKLGGVIKSKLGITCVHDQTAISELMRGLRLQIEQLAGALVEDKLTSMALGLSHSLARYKLKFSPDKVDIMIVQAISLLEDLDKELNTYAMRAREWYGWHFPELNKLIPENVLFARVVKLLGVRTNASTAALEEILPEQLCKDIRDAAQVSMGTEVSDEDTVNITDLCEQVISISAYREQLAEYLKNRMHAIAPNLTVLLGEIIGAKLIAHAGSLLNLAKYPASTVQILGAEKALFRALKTKHDTPKYGLIYHASLIGQTAPKNKGKISRLLAAKASLSARVDALGEKDTLEIGTENRQKVEARIRQLEGKLLHSAAGGKKAAAAAAPLKKAAVGAGAASALTSRGSYSSASDAVGLTPGKSEQKPKKKRPTEEQQQEQQPTSEEAEKKRKKEKKEKKRKASAEEQPEVPAADGAEQESPQEKPEKKKKKKKAAAE